MTRTCQSFLQRAAFEVEGASEESEERGQTVETAESQKARAFRT